MVCSQCLVLSKLLISSSLLTGSFDLISHVPELSMSMLYSSCYFSEVFSAAFRINQTLMKPKGVFPLFSGGAVRAGLGAVGSPMLTDCRWRRQGKSLKDLVCFMAKAVLEDFR